MLYSSRVIYHYIISYLAVQLTYLPLRTMSLLFFKPQILVNYFKFCPSVPHISCVPPGALFIPSKASELLLHNPGIYPFKLRCWN